MFEARTICFVLILLLIAFIVYLLWTRRENKTKGGAIDVYDVVVIVYNAIEYGVPAGNYVPIKEKIEKLWKKYLVNSRKPKKSIEGDGLGDGNGPGNNSTLNRIINTFSDTYDKIKNMNVEIEANEKNKEIIEKYKKYEQEVLQSINLLKELRKRAITENDTAINKLSEDSINELSRKIIYAYLFETRVLFDGLLALDGYALGNENSSRDTTVLVDRTALVDKMTSVYNSASESITEEINKATEEINKATEEINKATEEINKADAEIQSAYKEFNDAEDAYARAEDAYARATAETSEATKEAKKAAEQAKDEAEEAKKAAFITSHDKEFTYNFKILSLILKSLQKQKFELSKIKFETIRKALESYINQNTGNEYDDLSRNYSEEIVQYSKNAADLFKHYQEHPVFIELEHIIEELKDVNNVMNDIMETSSVLLLNQQQKELKHKVDFWNKLLQTVENKYNEYKDAAEGKKMEKFNNILNALDFTELENTGKVEEQNGDNLTNNDDNTNNTSEQSEEHEEIQEKNKEEQHDENNDDTQQPPKGGMYGGEDDAVGEDQFVEALVHIWYVEGYEPLEINKDNTLITCRKLGKNYTVELKNKRNKNDKKLICCSKYLKKTICREPWYAYIIGNGVDISSDDNDEEHDYYEESLVDESSESSPIVTDFVYDEEINEDNQYSNYSVNSSDSEFNDTGDKYVLGTNDIL